MVDFTDLIPAADKESEPASLSFDDLVPAGSKPAAPRSIVQPDPQFGVDPEAQVFESLKDVPKRAATPAAPPEPDPFEGESFGDLASRRGQQVAAGATEAFASVPEGVQLLDRQRQRVVNESAAEALPQLMTERDELEAILTEMRPKAKAGDWEAGARVKAAEQRLFMVNGQIQMASRMREDSGRALDLPMEQTLGFQAGEAIREGSQEVFGKPDERDQAFWGKVAYGAGNVIGMGGTAVVGGVVGGAPLALGVGAMQGATMNSSQIYKEAIEAGVDEETALEASNLGLAVGFSEILPIARALKILGGDKVSSTLLRKAIDIAKSSGEEGLQEFGATVANNMIAQGYYDPERGTFQGAGEAALIGMILGGATGTVGAAASGRGERKVDAGEISSDQRAALDPAASAPPPTIPTDAARPGAAPATAPTVAPDEAAALGAPPSARSAEDIAREVMSRRGVAPVTPAGNAQPPAQEAAPAQPPAQETPAPVAAPTEPAPEAVSGPEAAGDTLPTVPEAPATIENQNTALLDPKNKRKAVFIPNSSYEAGEVNEPEGKTIGRVVLPEGILFFNKAKGYTAQDVRTLYKSGRLGSVLGLGDFTKADVAASAARGNPTVAVTERTPEGTEVKAAAGTTETAPDQLAALEANKTPENTVQVEAPEQVVADRLAAREEPVAPAAPAAPAAPQPTAAERAKAELEAQEAKARGIRENAIRSLSAEIEALGMTVDEVLAKSRGEQQKVIERAKRERAKPKAQAAKDTSRQRSEPEPKPEPEVTQEGNQEPEITVDPQTGRRIIRLQSDENNQRLIQEAEERNARQRAEEDARIEQQKRKDASAEGRIARRKDINNQVAEGRLKRGIREAVARVRAGNSKDSKRDRAKVASAVKAQKLLDDMAPKRIAEVKSKDDVAKVRDRLNRTLATAAEREIAIPREVNDSVADAVVWLVEVQMMARKLNSKRPPSPAMVQDWLVDEGLLVNGDARPARERRRTEGEAMSAPDVGGDADAVVQEEESYDPQEDQPEADIDAPVAESEGVAPPTIRDVPAEDDGTPAVRGFQERTATVETRKKRTVDPAKKAAMVERLRAPGGKPRGMGDGEVTTDDLADAVEAADEIELRTFADVADMLSEDDLVEALTRDNKMLLPREAKLQQTLVRELAKALKKVAGETEVFILPDAVFDTIAPPKYMGVYVKESDAIYVRESVMEDTNVLAHIMLHEGAHAAFEAAISSNKELAGQLTTLLGKVEAHAKKTGYTGSRYGFEDVHEFLSEAWSNPQFQEFLATVPLSMRDRAELGLKGPQAISVKSAIMWLKNAVSNILDIKRVLTSAGYPAGTKSSLEAAFDIAGRLLEVAPQARADLALDIAAGLAAGGSRPMEMRNTDTSAFKKWFGDSKAVTPDGKPLVVYHGTKVDVKSLKGGNTNHLGFTNYGIYFSPDPIVADAYASGTRGGKISGEGAQIYPVYLKMENPKYVSEHHQSSLLSAEDVVKLKADGYDGVINTKNGELVVFEPTQIKSVFNRGTFDPANPDIRFGVGLEDKGTPKGNQPGIASKLKARGLNARQAAKVASVIRQDFDGKATDAQLDEIAALIREETEAHAELAKAAKKQGAKVKAEAERLQREALEAAIAEFTPEKNPGRPWLLGLLTNAQIGRVADRFFGQSNNPVRKIAELIERRRVMRDRMMDEMGSVVEDILKAQATHTKEQIEAFFTLAHDATMAGVHPNYPLGHKMNAHLGKVAMRGVYGKAAHADLAAAFRSLPPELQDLYVRTQKTLTDAQNRMTYSVMRNILNKAGFTDEAMIRRFHEDKATEADYAMVGEELAHHIVNASELKKLKGPYFNLVRRGDHVVTGTYKITPPGNAKALEPNVFEFKDRKEAEAFVGTMAKQKLRADLQGVWVDKNTGELYGVDVDGTQVKIVKQDVDAENRFRVTVQNRHVEFVDGRKDAKRLAEDLKEAGLSEVSFEKKAWERDAKNAQMLSDQFRSLMATLDKRGATAKLTPQQKAEMRGLLNEVSLRFLGSTRIQSSRLPRRYVQGASKDLVRNTYDYVRETAGYLAKLETEPMMEAELANLEERHKALVKSGTGANEGSRLVMDTIKERALDPNYGESNGPMSRVIDRILRASFIDYLASAGYSIVNSLQPALVTLPVLSGDFNPGSASYQLIKAYNDLGAARVLAGGVIQTAKATTGKKADGDFSDDMKGRLTEKRERDMIQELTDVGLLDSSGGLELVQNLDRSSSDAVHYLVDTPLGYLENIVRAMPQAIEAINRGPTALAAYRLMYARTKDHAKSVQYAKDAVDSTHGNYSASNAPPIFNNAIARLALQFKKYGQMIYTLLGHNVGRIIRNDNPGDRRKGVATLAYIAATHQIMAGSLGLPFLEIPRMVFAGLASAGFDDLEWEDFEEEAQAFYTELTGSETGGEVLTYGVTRGIPGGWGFDLSGRVGLSSILTFGEPRSGKEADEKAWLFDTLGGPTVAMGWDMKDGIEEIIAGKWEQGLQKVIPFKTITDTLKAARGAEGGTFNEQDAVLRVLGLTSARQARLGEEKRREIDEASGSKDQRNKIISDFVNAVNEEERRAAWRRAKEFNANLEEGERGLTLDYLTRLRAKERARFKD